ncbi:MAG: aldo/keto reductase [Desulfobulbaceae bacterium]|nr:aldo/keto reductase [Desulfobulbaceae bacterium]
MKTLRNAAGRKISSTGLGGEGVLRTYGRTGEAQAVIRSAVEGGITYYDSAQAYSDSEIYYGGIWQEEPSLRRTIFQTSKSAARLKEPALTELQNSLRRLHTDYLDLWQIHDVRTEKDLHEISGPGGALEAFVEAKNKGLVRHIGVTGHHDPAVLTRAVRDWPVDTVLLPVNPVEGILGGFLTDTLHAAAKKEIAVIGMKVMGGGHYILPKLGISATDLIRYALVFDISLPIVGCASPAEVRTLVSAAESGPLSRDEMTALEEKFRPYAPKMAYYRGVW